MNLDKINYYGVSRADYQACQEQIDRHATTYLVFVVLVAVLLTDKFWTTRAFYLAMLLVLSFCSYYFKGPIMWELDSFNGLTFTLVALALNYIVQRERIASFLLFNKYKENQRELRVQANFDYLSGVILRSTFMDLLQKAIEQPECTDLFIGLVDIDYFKQINDNYGRRMGGLAIQRLSQCLEKGLEVDYRDRADFVEKFDPAKDNVLARLGGDEFVFACHCPSEAACLEKMQGLQAAFAKEEIALDGQRLS